MRKKVLNASEMGKLGGGKNRDTKPRSYFVEIGIKGNKSRKKKDPEFYKRFSQAGIHAREVKKQAWIKANIRDETVRRLTDVLTGGQNAS